MATNIETLTALRGIAALAVLVFHCAAALFGGGEHVPMPLSRGYLAVDLFFLLSGFVLTHVYGDTFAGGVAWPEFKRFVRARFARTYPIHLSMLILLLPLYGTRPEFSGVALIHSLLLTQAPWLHSMSWNFSAWSISAEWHAYLLFPFLVMPWRRRSARAAIVVLPLCLATLGAAILASSGGANIAYTPAVLLRCLPEFIAGMGLYRVYRENLLARFFTDDRAAVAAALVAVGLAAIPDTDLAVIVALAALLLACAYNRGRVSRFMVASPFRFLGRISYSLYMVQMIAEAALLELKPMLGPSANVGAIDAAALALLSFAIAVPLSRYVEYPMRDWLRGRVPARA